MDKNDYKEKLYYSCRDEINEEWKEIAKVPPKIMMELTNECNHKCVFCTNKKMNRQTGFMDFKVFDKIAEEAYENGVNEIALYTTGESLLHKDIVRFVSEAKKIGFNYIYLTTNGALLNYELSKELLDAGLDSLRVSINAGNKQSYKKIHGKDDFYKVINNIIDYDNLRRKKKLEKKRMLSISCVLTKRTKDEKKELEQIVEPYVDSIKWTEIRVQGGNMPDTIKKMSTKTNDKRYMLKPCGMLWNGMHIDYCGQMTICCVDFESELIVGNAFKDGLLNCWNNVRMQQFRKMHLNKEFPFGHLCYTCLTGDVDKRNKQEILY